MRKIVGATLIASPFIGVIAMSIWQLGILKTLAALGLVGFIVACIAVGTVLVDE